MKRGRYAQAAEGVSDAPDARDDGRCTAHGCPLPGAISDSTKGGGPWFCRHHFGATPSNWQEITASLRHQRSNGIDINAPATSTTANEMRDQFVRRGAEKFAEAA